MISDNGAQITFSRLNGVGDFVYRINLDGSGLVAIGPLNSSPTSNFLITHEGNVINYWPIFRSPDSSKVIISERINGTMQIFASGDNGVHMISLVDNSYFKPNPACRVPYTGLVQNSSSIIPEFPLALPILLIGITSLVIFHRLWFWNN